MTFSDIKFSDIHAGDALPETVKQLSQEKINLYAEAVGDFNPIHVDESFAAQTAFGGTIAHGMLILAYISEMMTLAFGESWLSTGKLAIRFKRPARSRDAVTISGKINSITIESNNLNFSCDVGCSNQNQEIIVDGKAMVRIPLTNSKGEHLERCHRIKK